MESFLAISRRWHGSIDERYSCIGNLLDACATYKKWTPPLDTLQEVANNYRELGILIAKCRSGRGLPIDRAHRNTLLKSTVTLCRTTVKIAVYEGYDAGQLTANEVHQLGFLLPGEIGGNRQRAEPTDSMAEVKVRVINEDFIRVVIDHSAGEDAAKASHGWPAGVRNAVIVIISADDDKEVYHRLTTRLHNDIRMPDGSHGKQFIIKAAFLKHVNDEPRFGSSPTFSMPLTTEDLAAARDRQRHEGPEAYQQEIESLRREIERLRAEVKAKK